ncbi:MAG TPA: hypothetical protein HPQ00_15545, partial [Magnetococcales bacterium]|nr:hypothetical protein [Magnetococcales bacterium]
IRKKGEKERTPEEGMRLQRLGLLQDDLFQARERMGQGRSALRSYHGGRAFRKGAAALAQLKRARERLLELPARLDALMGDGLELERFTVMGPALAAAKENIPPWLTPELLQDLQGVIKERTQALHQEIKGGLDSGKAETGGGPAAELLATLKEAEPLVAGVVEQYSQALDSLNTAKTLQAVEHQKNALVGLAKTRELFLAIKGLLDLAWQDENRIMAGLKPDQPQGQEQVAVVLEMQETNLTRLRRVGPKIVEELQQARKADAPEDAEKKAEDAKDQKENREADIRRLERANQLQAEVVEKMDLVRQDFAKVGKGDDDLAPVRARVEVVLKSLEELRGLFFSVEEHLRQTAQRQKDLLDETHRLEPLTASQDEKPLQKAVGPLQERQQNLAQTAGAIGDALGEQVAAIKKMPAEDAASPGEKKQEGVKQWEAVITQVR